jgi:hypothetical protein
MKNDSDNKLMLKRRARTLTSVELPLVGGGVSASFAAALFESSAVRGRRDPTTPGPRLVAATGSLAR